MTDNLQKVMTEAELSKLVRLSRTTLWQLRKEGRLPYCRVGTKILYKPEHVEEFLSSFEQRAA